MERNDLDFVRHLPVIHDIRMNHGNIPYACEIYFVRSPLLCEGYTYVCANSERVHCEMERGRRRKYVFFNEL